MRKIFLNWKEITSEVLRVEEDKTILGRFLNWRVVQRNSITIHYKTWWMYIVWEKDKFKATDDIKKPKYKIWDYVVWKYFEDTIYVKITSIKKDGEKFIYNIDVSWDYFHEDTLRLPTKEELNLYFR